MFLTFTRSFPWQRIADRATTETRIRHPTYATWRIDWQPQIVSLDNLLELLL